MKTLNKIIFALFFLAGANAMAQQVPLYTHYMYNTLSVNPAYAGSRDALSITALHRSQWVNFDGAPLTQTLTMHTPLKNYPIGLGLSVMNDKIGPSNNTSIFGNFSYRFKLNEKSKLALGLAAGANIYQARLSTLNLDVQNDQVFQNNIKNRVSPNFSFGAYYSRERFYAGISAPNLIQNNFQVTNLADGTSIESKEARHYFLIAGAVFNITENLAFKPTTLIKATSSAPIQGDVTASFIIVKRLLVGAMFRTGDAAGALIGFDITEQFHIGYSFDWSYGVKTGVYNKGSHELMLRYDFRRIDDKQIHTPRYF